MRTIRMPAELHKLIIPNLQHILKLLPNSHKYLLPLLRTPSLPTLSHSPRPQPNPIEALPYIDHDAHDLVVIVALERLADGRELYVQPELVDGDLALVFELVGPFAAMLVLHVFPLGADTFLEEVVVGFEG
jgi:hypothetical protein